MLRYRLIDSDDPDDMQLLVRWYNDRRIRYLAFPHANRMSYNRRVTAKLLQDKLESKHPNTYRMYIVEWNETPIGEMSLDLNSEQLFHPRSDTAWLGLIIGEEWARGMGLGKRIMKKLETIAKQMGATRVELGVFVFNERAIKLYEKMDYKIFARKPKTTWWDGQFWDSIHMEKSLGSK